MLNLRATFVYNSQLQIQGAKVLELKPSKRLRSEWNRHIPKHLKVNKLEWFSN